MPIYEYECEECGKQFEIIQKFSDEPLKSCPDCKGRIHKLISQSSFILKGTGWYVTDYARKDCNGGKKKPGVKESSTETKAETKTESKGEGGNGGKAESKPATASKD